MLRPVGEMPIPLSLCAAANVKRAKTVEQRVRHFMLSILQFGDADRIVKNNSDGRRRKQDLSESEMTAICSQLTSLGFVHVDRKF